VECGASMERHEKREAQNHLNKVESFACDTCRGWLVSCACLF
jgi:hypothetical protein